MKKLLFVIVLLSTYINASNNATALEQTCNAGEIKSCYSLGKMHYEGERIRQNYNKAIEFYAKACDGAEAWGVHGFRRYLSKWKGCKS